METKDFEIVFLPREQWKGHIIPLTVRSDSFYDIEMQKLNDSGCTISLKKKKFDSPVVHTPEEYDYPDSLYQDHLENAEAYGILDAGGELVACVEVCTEEWSNRLILSELWVSDELQGRGLGKMLMNKAKEIAARQKRRAIILETQTCNTKAIGFYLHEGFNLIGFDICNFTNNDIGRHEVRINLGYFLS